MPFTIRIAAFAMSAMLHTVGSVTTATPVSATPHDRLLAATQETSLNDETLKPWHLKLDVTLFDSMGKNPVTGTIEAWRSGKQSRTVYTFGEAKRTLLGNENDSYQSLDGPSVPALADAVLSAFVDPGPTQKDVDGSTIELHTESFGKTKLDCIMLTQTIRHENPFPMGLFPTYCMDQGGDILRASYNFGSYTLLRNSLGHFQNHQVATHISLMTEQVQVADAKASVFQSFSPAADFFEPEPTLTAVHSNYARIAGGVIAGAILVKVQPVYPEYAKANHIGGTVVLRAIIGRDGHISYLRPVSAPDTSLAIAAIQAVRLWTYKPYILNGMPCDVDTTITVNFNLNRF